MVRETSSGLGFSNEQSHVCALALGMLDAAVSHKGVTHDVDMMQALHEMSSFCPQLTQDDVDFGADYVDNILPVKHMGMKWSDYITSLGESHFSQDGLPTL